VTLPQDASAPSRGIAARSPRCSAKLGNVCRICGNRGELHVVPKARCSAKSGRLRVRFPVSAGPCAGLPADAAPASPRHLFGAGEYQGPGQQWDGGVRVPAPTVPSTPEPYHLRRSTWEAPASGSNWTGLLKLWASKLEQPSGPTTPKYEQTSGDSRK